MLYVALLHYPVYNKNGQVVTTSIANMDIHDIARLSRTYGIQRFFIVHPMPAQRNLACEIINHWREGYGAVFNPARREAFELIGLKAGMDEVITEISHEAGHPPRVIATGANFKDRLLPYSDLKKMIKSNILPYLLIFGTGSGIACEFINIDYFLEPIKGSGDYNHLSVRSAAAIVIDRIMRD